ncbi:hypothetical protein [Pendulispora albinea]|uniref:Uncharacterized protein n=1 Tax=Pendulispora albinea TaxID=2741071 RepID=A0ABZ2LUY8_9BACT
MIPAAFQGRRILQHLNVAAVGFALSSLVGSVLANLFHGHHAVVELGLVVPTLLVGSLWAWLLRWKRLVGPVRIGWILSVPLAMLNSGLACAIAVEQGEHWGLFLLKFFLGATIGVLVWGPTLIATLLCFGLPIAWAQALAQKGLAGEERGERIVGATCLALSVGGFLMSFGSAALHAQGGGGISRMAAVFGALTGGAAMILAHLREMKRRRFVANVEAGRVENFRIDTTREGKVLVRVTQVGEGYRVADFQEELFELDERGDAKRAVVGAPGFRNRA